MPDQDCPGEPMNQHENSAAAIERSAGNLEAASELLVEAARELRQIARLLACTQVTFRGEAAPPDVDPTDVLLAAGPPRSDAPREATPEEIAADSGKPSPPVAVQPPDHDRRVIRCNARSCRQPVVLLESPRHKRLVPVDASTVGPDDTRYDPELGHVLHATTCPVQSRMQRSKS